MLLVGHRKNSIGQPLLEAWVVAELLEKLSVIGQQIRHRTPKRFVVFDPGILFVGIFTSILVRRIGRNFARNLLGDDLPYRCRPFGRSSILSAAPTRFRCFRADSIRSLAPLTGWKAVNRRLS